MTKHLAVIPARGGSKGLLRKNILPIAQIPTLSYSVRAAQQSGVFDEIVVVSDDDEILGIAEEDGVRVMREPDEMAGDTISSTVPVNWAIEQLGVSPEYVWNLQPTSPLRTPDDLRRAAAKLDAHPENPFLASVTPIDPHYFHWALKQDGETSELWFPDFLVDRSLLPPVFRPNGAIKVGRPEALASAGSVFAPGLMTVEIEDKRSIHIRSAWDLELVRFVVERFPEEFAWASR